MSQRQHSLRKVQTPDIGVVQIAGSFPSGYPFTDDQLDDDGYIATPSGSAPNDAYGNGFKGILKPAVGVYDILLDRVYPELVHACGSVFSTSVKSLEVQFAFPIMTVTDPSSGEDFSVVRLRLVGASATLTDLAINDRVSFHLVLRNSSV